MIDDSQVKSVRLSKEDLSLLKNEDFADFVRESIEEKKKKNKFLTRKEKINKVGINGFYVALGMLFFMMLNTQSNIITIAIIAGMGIIFTLVGTINMYLVMREDFDIRKKKQ